MLDGDANLLSPETHYGCQFVSDVKRMFRNARTYNEPGSSIYDASIVLQEAFIKHLHKVSPSCLPKWLCHASKRVYLALPRAQCQHHV